MKRVNERERDCITSEASSATAFNSTASDEGILWHRRLCHPSSRIVGLLPGVKLKSTSVALCLSNCDVCLRSKQTQNLFSESYNKTSSLFELIHYDLLGPYRTSASCGSRYSSTIVEDYSRSVWLYLLPDKTTVPNRLPDFIALIKGNLIKISKTLRSDNGTEFMCLTKYFRE